MSVDFQPQAVRVQIHDPGEVELAGDEREAGDRLARFDVEQPQGIVDGVDREHAGAIGAQAAVSARIGPS